MKNTSKQQYHKTHSFSMLHPLKDAYPLLVVTAAYIQISAM